MKSITTQRFRRAFAKLPKEVQSRARVAYGMWKVDPHHHSLHFKRVHPVQPVYSVRIGLHWRTLALIEEGTATWFWIGSHSEYDRILNSMR